jgi:hypothetical protein
MVGGWWTRDPIPWPATELRQQPVARSRGAWLASRASPDAPGGVQAQLRLGLAAFAALLRAHRALPTMETASFVVIGLTCNVVGVFFLANSIRFREPMKALEETFGIGRAGLGKAQDTALNSMQVVLGFVFLTLGFVLQAVGHWNGDWFTIAACAGILASAGAVYAIGAYQSRRAFKKLLREFFERQSTWSFTEDMELTKEVGQILGVPYSGDMTRDVYVHQVRQALGLPAQAQKAPTLSDRARRIALPR